MELLVDVQISVLGGDVVGGNWNDVPLQTQVVHLRAHTQSDGCPVCTHLLAAGWGPLTMLRVLCPTAPAGLIPRGPCSNTAPSDLLVELSQPPTRLLDSNKMTCRWKTGQFGTGVARINK